MVSLKKAWYRTFQCVFNICEVFLPQPSPELLEGAGSIKKLPDFIKSKGIDKVLIVTDAILPKLGLLNGLFEACDTARLTYVLYDGAEVNPSIECIEAAFKQYNDNKCQGFIAFGGGSSM
nr:iron-containing alcohol dehydrogenase [Oscillospiraceae bacterium]